MSRNEEIRMISKVRVDQFETRILIISICVCICMKTSGGTSIHGQENVDRCIKRSEHRIESEEEPEEAEFFPRLQDE